MDDLKNNFIAKELRTKANGLYRNKKFYDALVKYNQSLCYAEVKSEEMGYAYANRSAIYFEIKEYRKVIENIQKAIENSYPKDKMKTLLDRKEKAEKLIHTMPSKPEKIEFKLTYKANEKYPSFADCIELREDSKYGRHLITNRDLKPGDIIAIEAFFYYSTKTSSEVGIESSEDPMNYQVCAFCFNSNLLDLHPCDGCVSMMYCSDDCKQKDFPAHNLECDLMKYFIAKPESYNVFRTFFKALAICGNSVDELQELIEEADTKKSLTIFDFDFSKLTEIEKNKRLVQALYKGFQRETMDPHKLASAIEFLFNGNERTSVMFQSHKEFITNFIIKLFSIQSQNCFEFSYGIPKQGVLSVCAGDCLCPGLTLINHSCAPNVIRLSLGTKFALFVTDKIKAGDQLFDCYGKDFLCEAREERQDYLMNYGFICDCRACKKNLPTLDEITSDGKLIEYASEMYSQIFFMLPDKLTPSLAAKFRQEILTKLIEYKDISDTKDVALLKEAANMCLTAIAVNSQKKIQ